MLTSCNSSFWDGMAQGVGGYGGYGMGLVAPQGVSPMGGTFIGPIYCPPINTQALQQQVQAGQRQAALDAAEMARSAQKAKEQAEAQVAYNMQHGIIPVVTSSSSTSSYSSNSSSTSNSNGRDCRRCMGTGKCQTCNGRGYYDEIGIGSGRHACPNCASSHNGKCASCNGTGKI